MMPSPRASAPVPRRACACGGTPGPAGACEQCRRKRLGVRRSASAAGPAVAPASVQDVLASAGRALDAPVRAAMEPRFGHSFASVRVHDDARAADSAREVGALAYAVGDHLVFGAGRFRPHTPAGRHLLAHELAHVVQARRGPDTAVRRQRGGTEEMHREIAEEFRRRFGLPAGGRDELGHPVGPSDGEIVHSRPVGAVPDLPESLVQRLRPATQTTDPAVRQAAVDELATWARQGGVTGIDWSRVRRVGYDPSQPGSRTESGNPMAMEVWLGSDPFQSVANLYSTFRHELVHVQQHHDHARAISRGRGVKEVYAYLWELEHAAGTGLARPAEWGTAQSGGGQWNRGLARVVDGLMRELTRMAGELHATPGLVPADEVSALSARVACALLATPWEVVHAVAPDLVRAQLEAACRPPASARPPTSVPRRMADSALSLPVEAEDAPAEREAEAAARTVSAGGSVAGALHAVAAPALHRTLRINEGDAGAVALRGAVGRLTGREVTLAGGEVRLGPPVPGAGSPTMAAFVERARAATRVYELRTGAAHPDGTPVRGAGWVVREGRVVITLNPGHTGEFTWTGDELVGEQLAAAVAAQDPSQAMAPAPAGGAAGMRADEMLTRRLPYGSTDAGPTDPGQLQSLQDATLDRVVAYINAALPGLSQAQRTRIGAAASSADGVTLAEIIRGVETNTPFRTRQGVSGSRVTATYEDPRIPPAGPGRTRRTVTFTAGAPGAASTPVLQSEGVACGGEEANSLAHSCCTAAMLAEIEEDLATARAHMARALARVGGTATLSGALRRHFGRQGTAANRPVITASLRQVASELSRDRHGWLCRRQGSGALGCSANMSGRTPGGGPNVILCADWAGPPFFPWDTVLHEVVHASGVGALGDAEERYLGRAGYPPDDALHNADSYAELVREVGAESWREEPLELNLDLPGSLVAQGGMGMGPGGAQPVLGARLEVTPLGSGLRVVDWTAGVSFLWLPRYGVVPPGAPPGTPAGDTPGRFFGGAETGVRFQPFGRLAFFDLSAGAGVLAPGGGVDAHAALSGRATAGIRAGTPSAAFTAGLNFWGLYDLADRTQGGVVVGLSTGVEWGGSAPRPEERRR
ncbi:MAG TPA: DUF4157 domain-containing protein [Longimicrobium sp.]|nr:DUF4157 domain-containing protein [Longimicrobium sp.]